MTIKWLWLIYPRKLEDGALINISLYFWLSAEELIFWTVVLEKTLESPLHCKIKPVHPKGNQSWIFIGRTDAEDENPILWPPDVKSKLTGKTLMLGKIEGSRRRGWENWVHHQLNGHDFAWTPGVSEGQGNLASCNPWGHKEWNIT